MPSYLTSEGWTREPPPGDQASLSLQLEDRGWAFDTPIGRVLRVVVLERGREQPASLGRDPRDVVRLRGPGAPGGEPPHIHVSRGHLDLFVDRGRWLTTDHSKRGTRIEYPDGEEIDVGRDTLLVDGSLLRVAREVPIACTVSVPAQAAYLDPVETPPLPKPPVPLSPELEKLFHCVLAPLREHGFVLNEIPRVEDLQRSLPAARATVFKRLSDANGLLSRERYDRRKHGDLVTHVARLAWNTPWLDDYGR